jgi:exosortase/archaeosortase family protein
MEGNTLILADKQFFVDEACSGIVSVMSIIACAVIYGVWRNRPPVHLVVLAVAGIGWATLMNVMRISVIAMAYQWYGVDWSKGTPHEMLGLAIFLCTFGALVSTDYALTVLLAPVRATYIRRHGDLLQRGAWLVQSFDWLQGWGRPAALAGSWGLGARGTSAGSVQALAAGSMQAFEVEQRSSGGEGQTRHPHPNPLPKGEGTDGPHPSPLPWGEGIARRFVLGAVPLVVFAVLGGAQYAVPKSGPAWTAAMPHNVDRALAMDTDVLPKEIQGAERISFTQQERDRDDVFGNYSRVYTYRDDRGNTYIVSCDFPLESGGHELTVCYQGIGWSMLRRELGGSQEVTKESPTGWGYAEADFVKPDGSNAFLVFCSFDEHGVRNTPATYSFWEDFWRSLRRQSQGRESAKSYTVQVWTITAGKVHAEQKQTARELLLDARERFREAVVGK